MGQKPVICGTTGAMGILYEELTAISVLAAEISQDVKIT